MEKPWDYEEVARWFLNDGMLYIMATSAHSADALWEMCNNIGDMTVGDVRLTETNVAYAWQCVNDDRELRCD